MLMIMSRTINNVKNTRNSWQEHETINNILEKEIFSKETMTGKQKNKNNDERSEQDSTMNVATLKMISKEQ